MTKPTIKRYLLLLTWLAAGLSSPVLAQKKVGPEFQVNTYTPSYQPHPKVSSDVVGNFVVVWSGGQDGDYTGIFGQRYDSDGNRLAGEFQVNTYTTRSILSPSVASDANGNFVVVWTSGGQDGDYTGIIGQRYDSNGNRLAGEFQVNTYTTGSQRYASVASDASGNFVVVWESYVSLNRDVLAQRYDNEGTRLGGEVRVNLSPQDPRSAQHTAVASAASGNFVVIWDAGYPDGRQTEIFGQRYESDGNPLGEQFHVNTYTVAAQSHPSVASDPSGNFIVVWQETGGRNDVFGQRYDSNGDLLGGEFRINTYTRNLQQAPSVASDAEGNFIVVWDSYDSGEKHYDIFGQRYDTNGNPMGGNFRVNTYTPLSQRDSSVASAADGNFVVVWKTRLENDDAGIFGQRFAPGCEASVQVQGDGNTAGTIVPVQVHIAHHRPKTVTVRWKLSLLDASGQIVAKHISPPHTFEPGDVLDQKVQLPLPDDLASGEYTLDLAIKQMAGTKGATTALRVIRAE